VLAFTDSTELLAEPEKLRLRFLEDGYVLLRGVIDRGVLAEVRECITGVCAAHGWFEPGADPLDAITAIEARADGDEEYDAVYDEIQALEAFHAVPHHASVRRCMVALLGESAFPHPLSIARLLFPQTPWITPPHQDYPNNQGTEDLYACWIPLGDCPTELGSLAVLRGSHRFGVAPVEFALGPGTTQIKQDGRYEPLTWVGGDFECGDAIIFHSLTVHRSLPNTTNQMRLSVDYRFQREGEALTPGCLEPHFGRVQWEQIYGGWSREDLKYYWRDKRYSVVPWQPTLGEPTREELERAVLLWLEWDPASREAIVAEMRRQKLEQREQRN
jgi:ectoine hydroxylase-related dioxygenase (phytanoyl-CoA dioxygenase family)